MVASLHFNETVFDSDDLILRVLWVIASFKKEKSFSLGTSYKTKDLFIRSSYYHYCEKPAWNEESHSLHVKVSDCPFRGSYLREFELSQGNSVNRIMKITQAHN